MLLDTNVFGNYVSIHSYMVNSHKTEVFTSYNIRHLSFVQMFYVLTQFKTKTTKVYDYGYLILTFGYCGGKLYVTV